MSILPRPPSRLEQALACRAAGLQWSFVGAGFELASERMGVTLVPLATGTVRASVTGYPGLTGLDEPRDLLDPLASHEFAPGDVAVDGECLVALAREPAAPALRQGFVLALEPGMAPILAAWLPRLERVARLAAEVASCARGYVPDEWAGQEQGMQVCADVVAAMSLDRQSTSTAIEAARREHWASSIEPWLAALVQPDLAPVLERVRTDDEAPG